MTCRELTQRIVAPIFLDRLHAPKQTMIASSCLAAVVCHCKHENLEIPLPSFELERDLRQRMRMQSRKQLSAFVNLRDSRSSKESIGVRIPRATKVPCCVSVSLAARLE